MLKTLKNILNNLYLSLKLLKIMLSLKVVSNLIINSTINLLIIII